MRKSVYSILLVALASIAPAAAAEQSITLISVSGKVLVNSGSGYLSGEIGQGIADGSSVFVGKGAKAVVASADAGCQVELPEDKVSVLDAAKLCVPGQISPTAAMVDIRHSAPVISTSKFVGLTFVGITFGAGIRKVYVDLRKPVSVP